MVIVKSVLAQTPIRQQNNAATLQGLEDLFANVVHAVLGLAGIALFIMLIVGGFKYITSGGDPKSTESAQKTLTAAIGGIVLVALAYLILRLIGQFANVDVGNFRVWIP